MSTLHANIVETSSGGPVALTNQGAYRAYIGMNTATDVVGESLNNSSSTDNGAGNRTFNFTNNFSTATYFTASSNNLVSSSLSRNFSSGPGTHSTSSCNWNREDSNGSTVDGDPNAHGAGIGNVGELA